MLRWACTFFQLEKTGKAKQVGGGRNKLDGVIFFVTRENADVGKKYNVTVVMLTIRDDLSKVLMLRIAP